MKAPHSYVFHEVEKVSASVVRVAMVVQSAGAESIERPLFRTPTRTGGRATVKAVSAWKTAASLPYLSIEMYR